MVHRGRSRGIWFCATIASLGAGCGGNAIDAASSTHPEHDASRDVHSTLSSGGRSGNGGTGARSGNADASLPARGGSSSTTDAQVVPCQCPPDAFFVEVRGDGDPVVLSFGGAHTPTSCEAGTMPSTPTGAATEACGFISVSELSACKGPNHAPPCLDVRANSSGYGTYVDARGLSWNIDTFDFRTVDAGSAANGTLRGNYDALVRLSDGGLPVAISGNAHVCGSLIRLLHPCH